MQSLKSTKDLSEISVFRSTNDYTLSTFSRVLASFNLGGINRILNKSKTKGISGSQLFRVLFVLPFINVKNIHQLYKSGICESIQCDDNTFYRFMKNPNVDWRGVLYGFGRQFLTKSKKLSVDEDDSSPKCLIVDDTQFDKTGKMIECIGKVFDHVTYLYGLGIKLLLLGYWEGKSFIPLDFSIHNEPTKSKKRGLKTKELNKQYSKQRDKNSHGYKRIVQISENKIHIALLMIKEAIKRKIPCDYVLADSWFISEYFINEIVEIKNNMGKSLDVIGLMKTNRNIMMNDKTYKLNKLSDLKRKMIKRSKKLKCDYIIINCTYKGIPMKFFLVRMKGQQNWKALCTTNLNLSFVKTMEIYQIRWTIEVAFKDMKQNLSFGKSQSTDFDSHIASLTITCLNYIALSFAKRFEDYESIGQLFHSYKDIMLQDHLLEKLWKIIIQIYVEIMTDWGVSLDRFLQNVINSNGLNTMFSNFFEACLTFNSSKLQLT